MPKIFAIWMLIAYPACFWITWRESDELNPLVRFVFTAIGAAIVFVVLSLLAAGLVASVEVLFS